MQNHQSIFVSILLCIIITIISSSSKIAAAEQQLQPPLQQPQRLTAQFLKQSSLCTSNVSHHRQVYRLLVGDT